MSCLFNMAKKAKKLYRYPGCRFTIDEETYIEQGLKMTPYNSDTENMVIHVPASQFNIASESLIIRHLCNKFGFTVQSYIDVPGESLKEVYDPQLVTHDENLIFATSNPVKMEMNQIYFDNVNNCKIKIFSHSKDRKNLIMSYLDIMKLNFQINKTAAQVKVNSGQWTLLT